MSRVIMNLQRQQMPLSSSNAGIRSTAYSSASQHDAVGDCGDSWHEITARLVSSNLHVCADVGEVANNGADTRQRSATKRRRAMVSKKAEGTR